jgi:hypothetical protein
MNEDEAKYLFTTIEETKMKQSIHSSAIEGTKTKPSISSSTIDDFPPPYQILKKILPKIIALFANFKAKRGPNKRNETKR